MIPVIEFKEPFRHPYVQKQPPSGYLLRAVPDNCACWSNARFVTLGARNGRIMGGNADNRGLPTRIEGLQEQHCWALSSIYSNASESRPASRNQSNTCLGSPFARLRDLTGFARAPLLTALLHNQRCVQGQAAAGKLVQQLLTPTLHQDA